MAILRPWVWTGGLSIALCVSFCPLADGRKALRQTTLIGAWWWALAALALWTCSHATGALLAETPWDSHLRYLAAVVESNKVEAYSDQYKAYKGLHQGFSQMKYEGSMYPHRVIIGDPDQCFERIKQIQATGVTNVSLLANFGGLEHAKVLASLDRFAKTVMPRF